MKNKHISGANASLKSTLKPLRFACSDSGLLAEHVLKIPLAKEGK
jgi:hypothetical protein